jgi:hypothetical protein
LIAAVAAAVLIGAAIGASARGALFAGFVGAGHTHSNEASGARTESPEPSDSPEASPSSEPSEKPESSPTSEPIEPPDADDKTDTGHVSDQGAESNPSHQDSGGDPASHRQP